MLTGKCKEAFEKWYSDQHPNGHWYALVNFYGLPFSMKYGVYLEFFDSVGILVKAFDYPMSKGDDWWWDIRLKNEEYNDWESGGFKTRQEAQKQAIIKANEIYNEGK